MSQAPVDENRRRLSHEECVGLLSRPPEADLVALDEKYGRTDFSSGWSEDDLAAAVILVLGPERWIAWADWD